MLLVGYFEGLESERGIAWRCADSLSLRQFLKLGTGDSDEAGRGFRFEAGHDSDLKPAAVPI
jgi:hypothetical protein